MFLGAQVMQALVEHFVSLGQAERVERCVLKMDILSLDLNQVCLHICACVWVVGGGVCACVWVVGWRRKRDFNGFIGPQPGEEGKRVSRRLSFRF